jgi:hypothetical protein
MVKAKGEVKSPLSPFFKGGTLLRHLKNPSLKKRGKGRFIQQLLGQDTKGKSGGLS